MLDFASSSASREIAESFLNESSNTFTPKTILKFTHPQLLVNCVDVSWLSPFSNERELIFRAQGTAIFEPVKEDDEEERSRESFKFVKNVKIVPNGANVVERGGFIDILKDNLKKLGSLRRLSTKSSALRQSFWKLIARAEQFEAKIKLGMFLREVEMCNEWNLLMEEFYSLKFG